MSADEPDGRVDGGALLAEDGTREDGVEATRLTEVDLHLRVSHVTRQ